MNRAQAQAKRAELLAIGADVPLPIVVAIGTCVETTTARADREFAGQPRRPEIIPYYSTFPNNPHRCLVRVTRNEATREWTWTIDAGDWQRFWKATVAWETKGGTALALLPAPSVN